MKKPATKTNREWHEQHRMPLKATFEQRVEWHMAHAAHCQCREMPDNIKQAISLRTAQKG